MKKYIALFVLLLTILILICSGCGQQNKKQPFELLFSGNMMGNVAPCKCPSNRAGGLPKRLTLMNQLEANELPQLRVDAGNFAALDRDIRVQRTELILMGLKKLNYDAVNVGYRDLQVGLDPLATMTKEHSLPIISANIHRLDTDERVFDPHRIVRLSSGLKIALIGIARSLPNRQRDKRIGARFADPVNALQQQLEEVASKSDLTILLTDGDWQSVEEWLLKLDSRPDLILSSTNQVRSEQNGMNVAGVPFYFGIRQGKLFQQLSINPAKIPGGKWYSYAEVNLGSAVESNRELIDYLLDEGQDLGIKPFRIGAFQ